MEVVGIGGMGVVYRAEQLSLHREVALKVLSAELGRDEAFCERFRREGMHVSRLDHPNVIPIYDAGADKGRLYLAMRLVDGMTLAERIRSQPLSAAETLEVLRPIADGLDCAHTAGLVHRDVKPQNILLTESGHPYLTDFGVAKSVDTVGMTDAGGFVGSVHYAAPEQILGTPTSAATDVYALAVVLYQCVTGTVPHGQHTQAGALFAHINEPPPRLRLPEAAAFNAVIEQGMAKDPADRYERAEKLIDAAEHALEKLPSGYVRRRPTFSGTAMLPVEALPQTAANVTKAPLRRPRARRIAAVIVGLTVAVALTLGTLLLSGGRPASAAARVARSGVVAIGYRSPWTATHRAFAADVLTPKGGAGPAPLELRFGEATMAAGALVSSAVIPGGAPPSLVIQFHKATASRGRLADGAAVARYAWALGDGRTVDVWVIPTARGDVAIICSAPTALAAALHQCAAMATHARVSGVPLLAVGEDVGLARLLQRAAGLANAPRLALAADRNSGPWPAGKVVSTADADNRAIRFLRKLDIPPRFRHIVSALARALGTEAQALRRLAHADRTQDSKQYSIASAAITRAGHTLKTMSRQARGARLLKAAFSRLAAPAWSVAVQPPAQTVTGHGASLPSGGSGSGSGSGGTGLGSSGSGSGSSGSGSGTGGSGSGTGASGSGAGGGGLGTGGSGSAGGGGGSGGTQSGSGPVIH
jgi:hypothetical protein